MKRCTCAGLLLLVTELSDSTAVSETTRRMTVPTPGGASTPPAGGASTPPAGGDDADSRRIEVSLSAGVNVSA